MNYKQLEHFVNSVKIKEIDININYNPGGILFLLKNVLKWT